MQLKKWNILLSTKTYLIKLKFSMNRLVRGEKAGFDIDKIYFF